MTTLIHHCEGGKGGGAEPRCGWCGWREWAAPAVTSHYSTKQVPSSHIFQLQQQNANDRSFGYSSLQVHMANMIMTVTDRIKVTLTDGGWQHLFCRLNPSLSHFFCSNQRGEGKEKKCATAIILPIARCPLLPLCCCPALSFN